VRAMLELLGFFFFFLLFLGWVFGVFLGCGDLCCGVLFGVCVWFVLFLSLFSFWGVGFAFGGFLWGWFGSLF